MQRTTIRRLSIALATAVVAGAAGTAQAATVTDDFSGGTHDQTVLSSGAVEIGKFDEAFAGATLPAGWTSTNARRNATVSGGVMSADATQRQQRGSWSAGEVAAITRGAFDAQAFQHIGLGVDFNDGTPWAIFSTGNNGVKGPGSYLDRRHLLRRRRPSRSLRGGRTTSASTGRRLASCTSSMALKWRRTTCRESKPRRCRHR